MRFWWRLKPNHKHKSVGNKNPSNCHGAIFIGLTAAIKELGGTISGNIDSFIWAKGWIHRILTGTYILLHKLMMIIVRYTHNKHQQRMFHVRCILLGKRYITFICIAEMRRIYNPWSGILKWVSKIGIHIKRIITGNRCNALIRRNGNILIVGDRCRCCCTCPGCSFYWTGLEADALHAEVRMMNGMNSNSIVRMRPGVAPMNKSPLTNALNLEMILLKWYTYRSKVSIWLLCWL